MKFGPIQTAPSLLDHLEATGVRLQADAGDIVYEAGRKLTEAEISALRKHKSALLDVLAARDLPRDAGEAVLPALRAYLSEYPHTAHFEPQFLKVNLYIFGYLEWIPSRAEVTAALEALDIERGAA